VNSVEWWHIFSKKSCDGYAHSQEDEDVYNEATKTFLTKIINDKTINIQNPNPKTRSAKTFMGPVGGS
jgi:hypothetical protein